MSWQEILEESEPIDEEPRPEIVTPHPGDVEGAIEDKEKALDQLDEELNYPRHSSFLYVKFLEGFQGYIEGNLPPTTNFIFDRTEQEKLHNWASEEVAYGVTEFTDYEHVPETLEIPVGAYEDMIIRRPRDLDLEGLNYHGAFSKEVAQQLFDYAEQNMHEEILRYQSIVEDTWLPGDVPPDAISRTVIFRDGSQPEFALRYFQDLS